VTELEQAGLPVAHICTMTPVAEMVGSNRVVAGNGIVHPVGDASLPAAAERAIRRGIVERALQLLSTPVVK
jgi:glycine reductase complex component B subunit gamma